MCLEGGYLVVTPREQRFASLAVEKGVLTDDQVNTLVEFESQRQAEGTSLTLWDSAVLKNMMDAGTAEKLKADVGELDIDKLGDFKLVRQLGRGGMGSVWLGLNPENEEMAVKVMDASLAGQRSFLTRFFREAQASIKLDHKNIVRGVAVGETGGNYFFAMEYIDGENVGDVIERDGPVPPERASQIILEVADALTYSHEKNIIHRDIKPDNIMLTKDGQAKLADLGLARVMGEGLTQLTGTGTSMGTPSYMAPEQCVDAKNADARSDIYSLGATWYHMLVGDVPFTGGSALEVMQKHQRDNVRWPADVRGRVSKQIILTIDRMMAKKPNARIQTMEEVVQTVKDRCMGERDIIKELGMDRETKKKPDWLIRVKKPDWLIRVKKSDGVKEFRVSDDKLRSLLRSGKVSPTVAVRRAGYPGDFVPIVDIPELAGVAPPSRSTWPTVYAGPKTGKASPKPGKRPQKPRKGRAGKAAAGAEDSLHGFLEGYSDRQKQQLRKKKIKKTVMLIVKILIAVVVIIGLLIGYQRWPDIKPRVMQLIGSGEESEGDADAESDVEFDEEPEVEDEGP